MVSWMWLSLSISHARLSALTWSIALNSKSNSLSWSMSPVFDRRMSGVSSWTNGLFIWCSYRGNEWIISKSFIYEWRVNFILPCSLMWIFFKPLEITWALNATVYDALGENGFFDLITSSIFVKIKFNCFLLKSFFKMGNLNLDIYL